jgi:primosomal protein N' (replication factor Y)
MFGKKLVAAIVINKVKKPTFKTSSIKTVLLYKLPCSSLNLLNWMLEYYPDDYGSIGSLFLPPNLDVKSRSNLSAKIVHGLNKPLPKATSEQKLAINQIAEASKNLLLGVTGSGKTRVFTSQILETIKAGKSVFVLTPEIGLTPQLPDKIHLETPNIAIVAKIKTRAFILLPQEINYLLKDFYCHKNNKYK